MSGYVVSLFTALYEAKTARVGRNQRIATDKRVENVLLTVRDGVQVVIKK